MKLASWITAPFTQPEAQDTPVMIAIPQPTEVADETMIFRSTLLRTQGDGPALREVLDRMIAGAPEVAAQVILSGSLGQVSLGRAVAALRTYQATGVAVAPTLGL